MPFMLSKNENMSKFSKNERMRKAVCKNCRMPQSQLNRIRSTTAPAVERQSRPTRVEKKPKANKNFYHTLPYPYKRHTI